MLILTFLWGHSSFSKQINQKNWEVKYLLSYHHLKVKLFGNKKKIYNVEDIVVSLLRDFSNIYKIM
jgi:hypothetical protein